MIRWGENKKFFILDPIYINKMVLQTKTDGERINSDFLWLGKNTSKLQKTIQEKWVAVVDKKLQVLEITQRRHTIKQKRNILIKSIY